MSIKKKTFSLMDVLLNRDNLIQCEIAASLHRSGHDIKKIHKPLKEGLKKAQKEFVNDLQNHAGEAGLEILKDLKRRYKSKI
ncbi:MAG: hypothetical protein Q7S12_04835 [bacterium]|nr:hypothetical protein [bacterium]